MVWYRRYFKYKVKYSTFGLWNSNKMYISVWQTFSDLTSCICSIDTLEYTNKNIWKAAEKNHTKQQMKKKMSTRKNIHADSISHLFFLFLQMYNMYCCYTIDQ